MADTKVSALTAATPVGTDYLYLVDDPAGTPLSKRATVAALLAVEKAFAKNALDADTGITVDAGTDVATELDTLFESGHDVVFLPGGVYTVASQLTPAFSSSCHIILAHDAVITATAAIDDVLMAPVITNNATVTFTGGVWDIGEARNSTGVLFSAVGAYDNSGNATGGVVEFRDDTAGRLIFEDYVMTSRTGSYDKDYTDAAEQHWMGRQANCTYDETGGASEDLWTSTGHPFKTGEEVYFSAAGTGATGYAVSTKYFVINATSNTFQLSATLGGAAIAGTGDSAGTWTLDANNGGDSHIFGNASDGGELIIRNGVHLGCRSSSIYIAGGKTGTTLTDMGWLSIDNIRMYWCAGGVSVKADHETWTVTNCLAYHCPEGFKSEDGTGTLGAIQGSFVNCKSVGAYQPFYLSDTDSVHVHGCIAEDLGPLDRDGVAFTTAVTSFNTRPRGIWLHGAQKCVVDNFTVRGTTTSWSGTRAAGSQPQAIRIDASATDLRQSKDNLIRNIFLDGINQLGAEITRASATDPDQNRIVGVAFGESVTDYSTLTILGTNTVVDHQEVRRYVIGADQSFTNTTTVAAVTGWGAIPVKIGAVYKITGNLLLSGPDGASNGDLKLRLDPSTGSEYPGFLTLNGLHTTVSSLSGSARRSTVSPVNQANTIDVGVDDTAMSVELYGVIDVDATGTFAIDAAQLTANATPTVLKQYSWLQLERIG